MSKTPSIVKTRPDGTVVEVLPDGSERPFPEVPMRPMTEAEIAAAADPEVRPMTAEEFQAARRVPRAKTLRRALGLTQEQFAARYQIPLGTLRDWEQGRAEPDQPARAYLKAIAGNPEAVQRALQAADSGPPVAGAAAFLPPAPAVKAHCNFCGTPVRAVRWDMTPDRDRQRSYRQRQRDRGKARVALWLTPVQLAALDARRGRESRTAYLGRLVAADLEIPFRPPPEASGEAPGPTPAD